MGNYYEKSYDTPKGVLAGLQSAGYTDQNLRIAATARLNNATELMKASGQANNPQAATYLQEAAGRMMRNDTYFNEAKKQIPSNTVYRPGSDYDSNIYRADRASTVVSKNIPYLTERVRANQNAEEIKVLNMVKKTQGLYAEVSYLAQQLQNPDIQSDPTAYNDIWGKYMNKNKLLNVYKRGIYRYLPILNKFMNALNIGE